MPNNDDENIEEKLEMLAKVMPFLPEAEQQQLKELIEGYKESFSQLNEKYDAYQQEFFDELGGEMESFLEKESEGAEAENIMNEINNG